MREAPDFWDSPELRRTLEDGRWMGLDYPFCTQVRAAVLAGPWLRPYMHWRMPAVFDSVISLVDICTLAIASLPLVHMLTHRSHRFRTPSQELQDRLRKAGRDWWEEISRELTATVAGVEWRTLCQQVRWGGGEVPASWC